MNPFRMRFSTIIKTISFLFLLNISLLSFAEDEVKYAEINSLGFSLNTANHEASFAWIASGYNQSQPLIIPSTITSDGETYTVTAIGSRIFDGYKLIPSITVPSTLKTIGDYAFSNCTALTSLEIPEGVTYIGRRAFNNCTSLTSLTFPESVEKIGDMACFNMKSLRTFALLTDCQVPSNLFCNDSESSNEVTTLILGDKIETIPMNFMKGATKLENVQLGENVKVIKNSAFENCQSLRAINLPAGLTNIELYAFYQCENLAGKLTFPASCIEIGEAAFKGCFSLEEVEFNGIQKIGQNAFEGDHSIRKVTINEGTEQINVSCFAGCSGITELELPSTLKVLQSNAFQYCTNLTFTDFILPENVTILGSGCFQGCDKIEKVTIPAACTTMGGTAFKDCKGLRSAEILAAKGKIGAGTFQNCTALEYVHIGGGVTGINNNPFQGCSSLKTVNITAPLTTIGINCFSGCSSIEEVMLPETLQTLNTSAFQGTSVHEYNLPAGVTSVARMSMDSNPSAIRSYRYGVPAAPSDIIQNYKECELHVVSGFEADYAAHPIWQKFSKVSRLPEPSSVNIADKIELKVNDTYQLECELMPADTYARLYYQPQDESIIAVDADGLISGLHHGTTTIKITNVDGIELGNVIVNVTGKYDAPKFNLLTWSEANYKAKNGGSTNSNKIISSDSDASYQFTVSNWQEMTAEEIEQFHSDFQAFKNDKSDQFYNTPDGRFTYSITLSELEKGTYLTIDGLDNDGKHWGVPETTKNAQYATDGSQYFELWDGSGAYPIIYNYVDGKDVTIEFYTLTFPEEKPGMYITGPNQPHEVTLHIHDIVAGEQYTAPQYKLLVWDEDTYKSVNGNTNRDKGSHEDAVSSHDFSVSEWQPMTAEEIEDFKAEYYEFKGSTNANKWYNEPDGKFVHTVRYTNVVSGTHFTIDGRSNDNKHYGVADVDKSNKYFSNSTPTFHELWSDTSGHPAIYTGADGKDITVQFSTLTFPSNNSGGFTGEPNQPRYVSFAAADPMYTDIEEIDTVLENESTDNFEHAPIYDIEGRYLGTDVSTLPAGIYIQIAPGFTRKLISR